MTSGGDFEYKQFRKEWDHLLESQKYKEAEKLCHEGLAKSPLDQSRGRLYNHLGYLYENFLDDKTFDDILEHYVLSLQVDESNANSHYNLANFLLEQGMQHLLRALELNPNHGKANKRYANLTPIKANTTLDLGGYKYQVVEVADDGVRAIKLRKRNDGGYERSDDEPVYVEVSSPENVYPSSSSKGRTKNIDNGNQPAPLSIDDPNSSRNSNNTSTNGGGCCYKCVLYWWFWALLWIIAVGGVAVPVLGYFNIFADKDCKDIATVQEVALNTDTATQGNLNVLFLMDCGANDWNKQFVEANNLLNEITNDNELNVRYDILQYCNLDDTQNGSNIGDNYKPYTSSSPIIPSDYTKKTPQGGENKEISGALEACNDTYSNTEDTAPFLCVPFISREFSDTFDAMTITSDPFFADIYLAFMVDETNANFTTNLYSVLGAFATGTECIDRMDNGNAIGNTWWGATFYCNSYTEEHEYCPHCINYGKIDQQTCATTSIAKIFSGQGVTEKEIEVTAECTYTHEYEDIFFYCIGGVVPLLFWVFIVIFVLCCKSCKNSNKSKMEAHNGLNNNNQQTAFV